MMSFENQNRSENGNDTTPPRSVFPDGMEYLMGIGTKEFIDTMKKSSVTSSILHSPSFQDLQKSWRSRAFGDQDTTIYGQSADPLSEAMYDFWGIPLNFVEADYVFKYIACVCYTKELLKLVPKGVDESAWVERLLLDLDELRRKIVVDETDKDQRREFLRQISQQQNSAMLDKVDWLVITVGHMHYAKSRVENAALLEEKIERALADSRD